MTTPGETTGTYSLQDAEEDIANLQGQISVAGSYEAAEFISPLFLGYATTTPRGPYTETFSNGASDVATYTGVNCALTASSTAVTGWPTGGSTFSMLLTANGAGQPSAVGPQQKCQPSDIINEQIDIYCPAALNHIYIGVQIFDDNNTLITEIDCIDTAFTAGEINTLSISAVTPSTNSAFYAVVVGDHNADASGTLIYADNIQVSGNLIFSISTQETTDSVGNVIQAGFEYNAGFVAGTAPIRINGNMGSNIEMIPSTTNFAEILFNSAASFEAAGASIVSDNQSNFTQLTINSPASVTNSDTVYVHLNSQNKVGSPASNANGGLGNAAGGDVLTWDKTGVTVGSNQDGNSYDTAHQFKIVQTNATISTSFVNTHGSVNLGLGWYHIEGKLMFQQGGAAQIPTIDVLTFGGALAFGTCEGKLWWWNVNNNPVTAVDIVELTNSTLQNNLSNFAAAGLFSVEWWMTVNVTTAGFCAPQVKTASGNMTLRAGSVWKIFPIRHP